MSARFELRVSAAELKRWRFTAALEGLSLSAWLRKQCDDLYRELHDAVRGGSR